MTEENPYRIELWGDSVESIRSFDVLSQRSVENLDEIAIYPATELMLSEARRQDGFARIKKETKQYAKNCGSRAIRRQRTGLRRRSKKSKSLRRSLAV